MNIPKIMIAFISTTLISGCASIVSKSEYPITINSNPDTVNITVTDEAGTTVFSGETPTTITLPTKRGYFKGKDYTVRFKKEGFPEQITTIQRDLDGWYIGNLVFGGFIGWLIVDPISGAMWKLDQSVYMDLATGSNIDPAENKEKEEESAQITQDGLKIVMLNDLPESLHEHLVRIQ